MFQQINCVAKNADKRPSFKHLRRVTHYLIAVGSFIDQLCIVIDCLCLL